MPFLEAEELGFGKDFENAHPLWNAAVAFILDKYLENRDNQRNSPQNSMIQRTLEYVRKLNNYSTVQNSEAARELMKKGDKFTDYESALINNLNIASVDEAITLIPSLKDKFPNTEILATRLAHLQDFQKSNDTDYNITSYSSLSQSYHNTDPMNMEDSKENDVDDNASMNQSVNANDPSPQLSNYSQTPLSNPSQSPYSG